MFESHATAMDRMNSSCWTITVKWQHIICNDSIKLWQSSAGNYTIAIVRANLGRVRFPVPLLPPSLPHPALNERAEVDSKCKLRVMADCLN